MAEIVEVDNRGLGPPQPMVRILDALKTLPAGGEVIARNDREPIFLYPILTEQGWAYETTALDDGSFRIRIFRSGSAVGSAHTADGSA